MGTMLLKKIDFCENFDLDDYSYPIIDCVDYYTYHGYWLEKYVDYVPSEAGGYKICTMSPE